MSHLINNHLKQGYSDYNLIFVKRYYKYLKLSYKILDVGCGHYRNLYLFYKLGFRNLYGVDRLYPNPIKKSKRFKVIFQIKDIVQGLPYKSKEFEITLCNYIFMFIPSDKIKEVIQEVLRVTGGFCIIETQNQFYRSKNSQIVQYNFEDIVKYVEQNKEFEILDKKIYSEKLIIRRIQWQEEEKL